MTLVNVMYSKVFSKDEFDIRVADVKRRMEKAGFDLLVSQDPANMYWLTGFDGWSFYVPQCVLVHLDVEEPFWFGRAQDAKLAHVSTYLPHSHVISFSEGLVHHPIDHPYDELVAFIKNRGWSTSRIGVEMDTHYYTARCHAALVAGLPDARFSNNNELVNWARVVKSESELKLMYEAGKICSNSMNAAIAKIQAGVPQYEVVAEIYHAQVMGVDGYGGDYSAFVPLVQVGEETSIPHLTWTESPLPDNALVAMEIAGVRRRYHTPLSRCVYIGKPPNKVKDLAKVIVEGVDVALELAKPGRTCEEVEAGWQAVLNRNGLVKESRVGYSIGAAYPPDWGERTCSLRPGDTTELQTGMCFHFQSGVWLDDIGCAVSEPFVVTDKGGERFCNVKRGLIEVE